MRLILTAPSRSGSTITRQLLGSHPDIRMTNELQFYMYSYREDIVQMVYNKIKKDRGFYAAPHSVDMEKLKNSTTTTIKERIELIEEAVYGKDRLIFGDKGIFEKGGRILYENNLPFKLIVLYRDLRDVISSVKLRGRHFGYETRDPFKLSAVWVDWLTQMLNVASKYAIDSLIIKFEDFVLNPGLNARKIEDFLGIQNVAEIENKVINTRAAHMGYYKKHSPNWRKELHPDAIEFLRKLGYIGDSDE